MKILLLALNLARGQCLFSRGSLTEFNSRRDFYHQPPTKHFIQIIKQ